MKRIGLWICCMLVVCAVNSVSLVSGATGQAVLAEIQNRYESTNDFEARFLQEFVGKMMKQSQKGEGKVYFKKKGMMRWDYRVPNQKFISNGKIVWYYQPDENQVLVYDLSNLVKERTPLAFLAGEGNLSRDFDLVNFNEGGFPERRKLCRRIGAEGTPCGLVQTGPHGRQKDVLRQSGGCD